MVVTVSIGDNDPGNATFKMILKEYFMDKSQSISLHSVDDIFQTWNKLHLKLKEKYFLMPEEDKEDAPLFLLRNRHGGGLGPR